MTEKYSPELVEKYLKEMKKKFPDTDLHLLEMAVLQYIFLDCDENYKPDENNEDYLKAKKSYEQKEFNTVLFKKDINVKD